MLESFILLIAIKYFNVPDVLKSLLSSARFVGMMTGLFAGALVAKTGIRKSVLLAVATFAAGFFLIGGIMAPTGMLFTIFLCAYLVIMESRLPFITALYADNYRGELRGKTVAISIIISTLCSLLISYISGKVLDAGIARYKYMMAVFSFLLMFSAFLFLRMPSRPVTRKTGILRSFKLLVRYPLLTYILAAWFVFGLGNLISFPLRMVYLVEQDRGLGLNSETVILLTGILPAISKLGSSYIWAVLFDKINVIALRIILNIFIGAGIFLFFQTENVYVLGVSVVITYIGFGGTPLIWNLWVTKIVPREKVQESMSLHTFFTGVRGFAGPFIGFYMLARIGIKIIGCISALMFVVSIMLLLPMIKKSRTAAGADTESDQAEASGFPD